MPQNVCELTLTPAQRRTMLTCYHKIRAFVSNIVHQRDAGDAFAPLPAHILSTHVLSSGNLPDPSDLARPRMVSREMRDAVAATGREVYKLGAGKAIHFGDASGLQLFMHQRGDLDNSSVWYCTLAADYQQPEILQWLRENNFQRDDGTLQDPPHPASYRQVLAMLDKGMTPPVIRDIDDKPPDPRAALPESVVSVKKKPWEKDQLTFAPAGLRHAQWSSTHSPFHGTRRHDAG